MQTLRPFTNSLLSASTRSQLPRTTFLASNCTNHQRIRQPSITRSFLTNPLAGPQVVKESRTLQYPTRVIYDVISDVSSYSLYVPYCQQSKVTKHSNPAPDGKTYPEEAQLVIGFNDSVSESFWSRVYCVPDTVVESVSGSTETTLAPDEVAHHNVRPSDDPTRKDATLTHLLCRWNLRPFPYKPPPTSATHRDTTHKNHEETSPVPGQQKTEVNLYIEYQFANPMYGALSQAAAPKVAERMIEAFEKRVKEVVEGPASVR